MSIRKLYKNMITEATYKYDIELLHNKKYIRMASKKDTLINKLCGDITVEEREAIAEELTEIENEIRSMEFETLYEKGLQDGFKLVSLLGIPTIDNKATGGEAQNVG